MEHLGREKEDWGKGSEDRGWPVYRKCFLF